MALTLKDQSILVNGDINEGLLRLCHKLHRLRKEYAYTFESTSLSYQCSEVSRILQGRGTIVSMRPTERICITTFALNRRLNQMSYNIRFYLIEGSNENIGP
ncbi:hypothetical protein ZEAMMB73_Zm00001d013211 [Zea mays]|uniref:Uncharacterized protein n=1 Tax=Zea mays TaxID=4577 RepID=A0A1D6GGJ0_MAIZE|nr:hypothetical protein ZEAMMB73_Zm00001d013211 [Zea mays]AQK62667.1 hypothetical protein ZEAMMB73_Zm00001d013211 [Zea mays]